MIGGGINRLDSDKFQDPEVECVSRIQMRCFFLVETNKSFRSVEFIVVVTIVSNNNRFIASRSKVALFFSTKMFTSNYLILAIYGEKKGKQKDHQRYKHFLDPFNNIFTFFNLKVSSVSQIFICFQAKQLYLRILWIIENKISFFFL